MSDPATVLFQDANESLNRYENSAKSYEEQWKKDHAQAMRCLKFEELLAFGLTLFNLINRLDEAWRIKVYRKLIEYDPAVSAAITELYRIWLRPRPRLMKRLEAFEKTGLEVASAEEFRSACREVEGILTPDEDFFADKKFLELQSHASKENSAGKTEEFGRLSE